MLTSTKNNFFGVPKSAFAVLMTTFSFLVQGQHTVTLNAQYAAPNNCNQRVLTATVSGGSGNYTYFWNSNPSSGANLGNSATITVSPTQTTTYTSGVFDNGTGQFAQASVSIGRIVSGSFSVSIPNVMTPNGDGFNDTWRVMAASNGTGPINAYSYSLSIVNQWGGSVMSGSGTITTGTEGYLGGDIYWNGRINNTGSYVSNSVYYYAITLYNCSGSQTYNGNISVLGSPGFLVAYPNPASNEVTVSLGEEETTTPVKSVEEYEISIISKNGTPVLRKTGKTKSTSLDISSLPKDTYYIQVDRRGEKITQPLIVNK